MEKEAFELPSIIVGQLTYINLHVILFLVIELFQFLFFSTELWPYYCQRPLFMKDIKKLLIDPILRPVIYPFDVSLEMPMV